MQLWTPSELQNPSREYEAPGTRVLFRDIQYFLKIFIFRANKHEKAKLISCIHNNNKWKYTMWGIILSFHAFSALDIKICSGYNISLFFFIILNFLKLWKWPHKICCNRKEIILNLSISTYMITDFMFDDQLSQNLLKWGHTIQLIRQQSIQENHYTYFRSFTLANICI